MTAKVKRAFLTYEKLQPSGKNLAKLKPGPHPGAAGFDPEVPRSACRERRTR